MIAGAIIMAGLGGLVVGFVLGYLAGWKSGARITKEIFGRKVTK